MDMQMKSAKDLTDAVERLRDAYQHAVQDLLEHLRPAIEDGTFADLGDSHTVDEDGYEIHPGINLLEWHLEKLPLCRKWTRAVLGASEYAEDDSELDMNANSHAIYCLARDLRDGWRKDGAGSAKVGLPPPPADARTGCRPGPVASNVLKREQLPSTVAPAEWTPQYPPQSRGRRHRGTGMGDTPPWVEAAMRAEVGAGSTVAEAARRHGVIHSAAHTMSWRWARESAQSFQADEKPNNVVQLFPPAQ